jgi:glycerol-3-phosphate dehydrogenase
VNTATSDPECFDAIIVGAGVVGCATARKLTLRGARVLVLEKGHDILEGASKGNSAILHTGFDAPTGSIEQECLAEGYREYLSLRDRLGLPLVECGALVLAWDDAQAEKLDSILAQAHANDVVEARIVNKEEVYERESAVSPGVVAAVSIPGESLVDPWSTPHAYLLQAVVNGARVERHCEVLSGEWDGDRWHLATTQGEFTGRCVINCAGLYGDVLNQRLLGEPLFRIRPRKGQFVVYDKSAGQLVRAILLPVPSDRTKGIVVCRTVFGNLLVGPTAEDQDSRDHAAVDTEVLRTLMQRGNEILPALSAHLVTATYAGIRPATEHKDYQVQARNDPPYISVGGIRSTGLSGALGLANLVFKHYENLGNHHPARDDPVWPSVNSISEHDSRDWQRDGNGGIVCHCELVTRREIEQAFEGPLAVRSLGGLKRRTRVTMGRCQGFYCSARLGELTADHFDDPITDSIR